MQRRALQILYQDAKQVVINKPVLMSMQGAANSPGGQAWRKAIDDLQNALACKELLRSVHRLDSGTSGVLILAKTAVAARSLANQFQNNEISKSYLAVVEANKGAPPIKDEGHLDCSLKITPTGVEMCQSTSPEAKQASATYRLLASKGRLHLLELKPRTGRKHQLRIQFAQLLQAPVVGDFKYGYNGPQIEGHLLHCAAMSFYTWEKSGKRKTVEVHAPEPLHFQAVARQLGWRNPQTP